MAASVMVVDDGELQDVREMLDELEAEYCWVRPACTEGVQTKGPSRLLVTTARHGLQAAPVEASPACGPTRMAVLDDGTKTVCDALRQRGFDQLVRRPVHPVALRLLLLRALYVGEERRVAKRVAVGCAASYRSGFRRRPALLADLSRTGCRLHASRSLDPDTELRVQLPKELTDGESIELSGWVVRCERDAFASTERPYSIAVAFELLPAEIDEKLSVVIEALDGVPGRLSADEAATAWRDWSARAAARSARGVARPALTVGNVRRAARRLFRKRIAAITQRDRALRTLVGRNISVGGMLLDREPDLQVGDRLALALFGAPGQRLNVPARVVRSSDDQGLALAFGPMPPEATRQLEALISGLPPLEADVASRAGPRVVGEITRRERGPGPGIARPGGAATARGGADGHAIVRGVRRPRRQGAKRADG